MAERSTISQSLQIGLESQGAPGTPVAANRRLGSIGLELGVATDIKSRRPVGQKHNVVAVLGKEWVEGSLSGFPVYPELPFLFSGVVGTATKTTIVGDGSPGNPDATRWVFSSSQFDRDAIRTYTIEQGDSVRAHRAAYGLLTDLSLAFSRDDVTLDGTLIAQRLEDDITMTASPTSYNQYPVRPTDFSVYLDPTFGALGTTKLTRVLSGEFSIGSRFNPLWTVDRAQNSFAAHVEAEPDLGFTLTMEADDQGMAQLDLMRQSLGIAYIQVDAQGPRVHGHDGGTGTDSVLYHELKIEMACQITDTNAFSDEDGVYAVEWGFTPMYDPLWGNTYKITVVTTTDNL